MYSPPPDANTTQAMRTAYDRAAAALDVEPEDGRVWGWFGRTLSGPGHLPDGRKVWLRVLAVPADKALGKHWDGARAAQAAFGDLDGARPSLLDLNDWTDNETAYRAELTPYTSDPVCSATPTLHAPIELPDSWWKALASSLDLLAQAPTERVAVRQEWVDRAVPQFLGLPAPRLNRLVAVHGDLHWANLTLHGPLIFDWEGWGLGPAGFDAAMLHVHTLTQPDTAAQIRAAFPVLDSETGRIAEIIATAMLLQSVARGDHLDLAEPLQRQAERLQAT